MNELWGCIDGLMFNRLISISKGSRSNPASFNHENCSKISKKEPKNIKVNGRKFQRRKFFDINGRIN